MREEIIGRQRLILGDCREIMPALADIGAVVTDPPYGIGRANGMGGGGFDGKKRRRRQPRGYTGTWDRDRVSPEAIAAMLAIGRVHVLWGGNFYADMLPAGGRWLVWNKLNRMPTYSDAELAWTDIPGTSVKMLTKHWQGIQANADGRHHPTQKPVALMRWVLTMLGAPGVILDPFVGSGSTLVAAQIMGMPGIGIEIDPEYFDAACRRVEEATRQPDLFPPPPPAEQRTMSFAAG